MILKTARVTNFKIVEDSGEFSVDRVTCLVGKNESGKTALLEALYRLNPYYEDADTFDKVLEYPRRSFIEYAELHPKGPAKVVNTTWELEPSDVEKVEAVLGAGCLKSTELNVYKTYDSDRQIWTFSLDEAQIVTNLVDEQELYQEVADAAKKNKTVAELRVHLEKRVKEGDVSEGEQQILAKIQKFRDGSASKAAIDALSLPKFLYFGDYDIMSGNVALEDMLRRKQANQLKASEKVFVAFLALVGTSLEEINQISQFEPLKARLEAVSSKITRDVFEFWTQNRNLRVQFSLDPAQAGDPPPFNSGKILHTRIYNTLHDVSVSFDERSRGFVWFFSFLVLFSQVKKDYGNIVILLDEPGLNLHAKAQADLLRYIDQKLKPHHQVIYTTHSPFMVNPSELMSVRTVEDVIVQKKGGGVEVLGTKVGDDVLSTDRDTLFPLQGALGYEITQTLFVGENTLLLEGPSDLLYLKAFSEELRSRKRVHLDSRWTLCPVGGADKVSAFMSLFGANRLHVAVLVDFAMGSKKKIEEMRRSQLLRDKHLLTFDQFTGKAEADVEDMLGWANYSHIVNSYYGLEGKQKLAELPQDELARRVVKKVEEHFRLLPPDAPEFDHFSVSSFLMENRAKLMAEFPELDEALNRFEDVFKILNSFLTA